MGWPLPFCCARRLINSLIVDGTLLSMSSEGLSANSTVSTAMSFDFGSSKAAMLGSNVAIVER